MTHEIPRRLYVIERAIPTGDYCQAPGALGAMCSEFEAYSCRLHGGEPEAEEAPSGCTRYRRLLRCIAQDDYVVTRKTNDD